MTDPGVWMFVLTGLAMAALAYGATRLAGRLVHPGRGGRSLQVLEALPLGRDRALYLVRVGAEVLVVGSAPGGISRVHALGAVDMPAPPAGSAAEPFARLLERLAGRGEKAAGGGGRDDA